MPQQPSKQPIESARHSLVMSLLRHIGQYLSAVFSGLVGLMSGIAGIVLLVLLVFWGDDLAFLKDNKKTFVWMAFICLVVAGFSAWRKERQKWERLGGLAALSATPKEIVSVFEGRTTTQGEKLAKNYIGKWIRNSGPIFDVDLYTGPLDWFWAATVTLDAHYPAPDILLRFSRKWIDTLSVLGKGDSIVVLGQIVKVRRHSISLRSCELLEIGAGKTDKKGKEPES